MELQTNPRIETFKKKILKRIQTELKILDKHENTESNTFE